ncbi:MAG: hypothetical protein HYY80_00315 [Chloroflexi bacterium]|nr:hypothetical protein [Chloroflexota bacterium]
MDDQRIKQAIKHTEILRAPKQSLYTFGTTNIHYYLVTEPAYSELVKDSTETVVREGKVIAARPRLVTPYYLSHLEGFSSEARRYFETLVKEHSSNIPGLFYTYSNEPKELTIVSNNLLSVVAQLNAEIDKRGDPLAAIIKGEDALWDVSLMKFIYEVTRNSLQENLKQMSGRGLLDIDTAGIPADARVRIDELFEKVTRCESEPGDLKDELERWNLFEEYQDRFFNIFEKKR